MPPLHSTTSPSRYSPVAQALHWLTVILVLAAFLLAPEGSDAGSADVGQQWHETLGLSVFFLSAFRLFWRAIDRRPDPPKTSRALGVAASAVQAALYLLLFALPLTAMAGIWLEGDALTLLGGISFAPSLGQSEAAADILLEVHETLGEAILWVAGLHAAAALFHHFILRDNVLRSMLPQWVLRRLPRWLVRQPLR